MNLFLWKGMKHFYFTIFRYPPLDIPFSKNMASGLGNFFVFWPFRTPVSSQHTNESHVLHTNVMNEVLTAFLSGQPKSF